MRRRALAISLWSSAIVVACGIDVVGRDAEPGAPDASIDAPAEPDVTEAPDVDAGADATVDAGPKCASTHVVDALTTLDAGSWLVTHDGSNGDHPKIDDSAEGPALSFITPNDPASTGGIWLGPMPLHAFDVSFRYIITCTSTTACADGIAVSWLATHDAGPSEIVAASSSTLGIPPNLRGAAVALDVHQDTNAHDPLTPSLSILGIDPTRAPGSYDWHEASTPPDAGFLGAHDVVIRVRGGTVSATIDGATVATSTAMTTDVVGWFGISASTGGDVGTFVVRDFDGTFYVCDDP